MQDGRLTSEVADYIIQVYLKPTLDFDPSLKIKRSHKCWSVSQQTNVFSGHPHPTYRNSMTHSLRTTALNSLKVSSVLTVCGVGREETGNRARSERALGRLSPGLQSTLWTEHALWEKNKTSSVPEQDWKEKKKHRASHFILYPSSVGDLSHSGVITSTKNRDQCSPLLPSADWLFDLPTKHKLQTSCQFWHRDRG